MDAPLAYHSNQPPLSGLENIILHHSIFKGLRVSLACDGHTNNTGTNGAGKTSSLQLIPVFYGGEPDRLINRAAGKLSFIDYYLPSDQSMIVFEYRRSTGLACAVMYRRSLGAFAYRFITGGAKDTLFNEDNSKLIENGISAKELLSHLHLSSDIAISRQIENIIDYRSIIENNSLVLLRNRRDKSNFKHEAYDYCLGSPDSHMQHIHLLTSVTLDKRNILSNFKNMIIDAFLKSGGVTDLPKHSKDNELLSDIAGLQAFEIKSDQLRSCVEQWNELTANWQDIYSHQQLLSSLVKKKQAELKRAKKEMVITDRLLLEATESYKEEVNGKLKDKNGLVIQQDTLIANIDRLYSEQEAWSNKDVSDKKSSISSLPGKELLLRNEKSHLENLENQTSTISDKFNGLIGQLKLASGKENLRLQQNLSSLNEKHQASINKHEQKLIELKLAASIDASKLKAAHDAEVDSKIPERDALLKKSVSPGLSDEEQSDIELSGKGVVNSLASVESEQNLLNASKELHEQHTSNRDEKLKTLVSLKANRDSAQAKVDDVKAKLYPSDNSLLSSLRINKPDWGDTIGKTINPDILRRTNLSPAFTDEALAAESLYGLSLDLSDVEPCDEALDEHELIQRHRQAESELDASRVLYINSKDEQKSLEGLVGSESKEYDLIKGRLANKEKGLASAQAADRLAKTKAQSAAANRQDEFKRLLDAFDQKSDEAKGFLKEQTDAVEKTRQARQNDAVSNMSFLDEDFENNKVQIEGQIESCKSTLFTQIKELKTQLNSERERKGVDSGVIKDVEDRIKSHQREIDKINGFKIEVSKYELWLKQQWSQCEPYTDLEAALQKEIEQLKTTIKRIDDRFNTQKTELSTELAALVSITNKEIADTTKGRDLLEKCTERLTAGNYTDQQAFQTNFDAVFEHLHSLLSEEKKLREHVLRKMRVVQHIIGEHSQSQISRAWVGLTNKREQESHFDRSDDEFKLQCADDLQRLNADIIPQVKGTLIEGARSVGDSINRYYDNLAYLNRQISTVSNKLEKSINADHSFDVISDIKVGLHSKIKEDDTWSPLREFNAEWIKWSDSNFKEIPSDDFIRRLKEARESLDSVKIKPSVSSLIDIEISLIENGDRRVVIRNDNDLNNASSEGISNIATLIVFVGITRYLCPDNDIAISWPIDELGKIHSSNISKLFEMMDHHGIRLFSVQPNASVSLLKRFNKQYVLDKHKGAAQMVKQSTGVNPLAEMKSLTPDTSVGGE
ncbi:MAG: ATP-binding protein [Cycloclasticus sp.]|nr:ATP-binding protein [Cycloclasticus sp.]